MEVQAILNEITNLFTAIGDFFIKADWYPVVKWPFWILLIAVAAGGVYCARFGKKTLLNQGVCGVLNLVVIYLTAVFGYIHIPPLRNMFSDLPFLSVSDQAVSLVDPFALELGVLAPVLLRLMLLILLVNLCDSFGAGGKTLLSWFFSQLVTVAIGLLLYTIVTAGLSLVLPSVLNRFAIIPVVIVVVIGVLMLFAKFIFTVVISGGNPYFSAVYKFFTVNKGGSLFTTSSLSFLLFMAVLTTMHLTGNTTLEYAKVNNDALWIIMLMLLTVLYIFGMFYNDKKKS